VATWLLQAKRPHSGRLATADADPPWLSHGHLVGDSAGTAWRGYDPLRRPGHPGLCGLGFVREC